jgi:RND family efflux transporter MFP subunit
MTYRIIVWSATSIAAVVCAGCDADLRPVFGRSVRNPIPVRVETVAAERATPALHLSAFVEPTSSRLLAFQYEGRIERLRVGAGSRVDAGDVVAEFDLADLERRVDAARVAADRAERHVLRSDLRIGRRQQLFELVSGSGQSAAPTNIERTVREVEARYFRVELAAAEARFEAGNLRAPVAGIIDRQYRRAGAFASAGEPVFRLSEFHTVALRAAVPRSISNLVREGGLAEVRLGDVRRFGSIRNVGGAEPSNRGIPFEVWVANPDGLLQPGEAMELVVAVAGREARTSISLAALQRGFEAKPFCFVVAGQGDDLRAERRLVRLGGLRGDRVLVLGGLEVGERVVSFGNDLLAAGDPVTIVDEGR